MIVVLAGIANDVAVAAAVADGNDDEFDPEKESAA